MLTNLMKFYDTIFSRS